ncbi:MAG: CPBP family intramembrane metalloprotease [Propionibacteriaceae bacterium]|nr:CPBP family intramembrane metalloprotease [Propionibacteriaceae bacterium]
MAITSASAVWLIALQQPVIGLGVLAAGLALALWVDRRLARTLGIVACGLVILSVTSLEADLSDLGMLRFTLVLGGAVLVPTLLARRLISPDAVSFPVRGRPWTGLQWWYLGAVVVIAYLLLPFYFVGSGAYANWPAVATANEIGRLFVGVNAVGIWDELFFVCIVFALYRRHVPLWTANVLQAIVFVSFLWELGYRSWGPLLTIPFALVQGWIFATTASLGYVVTVHLLFDAIVFLVLVHAHNPHLFDFFVTIPA